MSDEQAVLVYLQGNDLPDEVYEQYDLATLEDQLETALAADPRGEYDGNEYGPAGVTLFFYGPDAELLFAAIQRVLAPYPLCKGGRAVLRYGEPGANEREILL